jgi:citrate lyase subunit beta / citryl-CoA lyase
MIDWDKQLLRSLLFVPGSDERKLAKVATFGADAIVIDLEDAVADEHKTAARQTTRGAIPGYGNGQAVFVRVNGAETGRLEEDIAAVVCPELDGIMVPKIEDTDTLQVVDRSLADAERGCGLEAGHVRVLALMETPRGIARCDEILSSAPARTLTAVFGLGDFSVALGVDLTDEGTELLYARGRVVVAARAGGLAAPIDGPYLRTDDMEGLLRDSRRSRGLGFQGRVTVYPPQVDHVLQAYSELSEAEAEFARQVVSAFEEAESRGVASLRVAGRFIDYPMYHLARAKLARYDAYLTERAA